MAELGDVEEKTVTFAATYSHLEEISQVFVDVFYKVDGWIVVANAAFQDALVVVVVQQYGISFFAVAPGPSCFLKIGFYGVWRIVVDDDSHIRLVDAHTESVCTDNDANLILLPLVLALILYRRVEAGMEESGVQVIVA